MIECSQMGVNTSNYLEAYTQLVVAMREAREWTSPQILEELDWPTRVRRAKLLQFQFGSDRFFWSQHESVDQLWISLKRGSSTTHDSQSKLDKLTEELRQKASWIELLLSPLELLTISPQHGAIGENCTICLDKFAVGQQIYRVYCSHVFHEGCMTAWFQRGPGTCPICRTPIKYALLH